MSGGVRLPDERALPPGPLRDLTAAIHKLYDAAGQPSTRDISSWISDEMLRGAPSHETVRGILRGKPTQWQNIDSVGRVLAARATPRQSPDEVAARLIVLWTATKRPVVADDEPDEPVLDELDTILEPDAERVVRGFVQPRLTLSRDQQETFDSLLRNWPRHWPVTLRDLAIKLAPRFDAASDKFQGSSAHLVEGDLPAPDDDPDVVWPAGGEVLKDKDFEVLKDLQELLRNADSRAFLTDGEWSAMEFSGLPAEPKRFVGDDIEAEVRRLVHNGEYEQALSVLRSLTEVDARRAFTLGLEIGFAELPDPDRTLIATVWKHTAFGNKVEADGEDPVDRQLDTVSGGDLLMGTTDGLPLGPPKPREAISAIWAEAAPSSRNARSGSLADEQLLLELIFGPDAIRALPDTPKRRDRPYHDVEFRASLAANPSIRCHVVCKDQKRPVDIEALAPTLLRLEVDSVSRDIDYLVLISLGSPVSDGLRATMAEWERRNAHSFGVCCFDIADQWRIASLSPRLKLPAAWIDYLSNPSRLCVTGEDHSRFDRPYQDQLPVRAVTATGAPVEGTLFDHVDEWLENDGAPDLMVLGEFGDGKTFFTYSLARRLCDATRTTARRRWIPLRLALRDLPRAGSARDLLRRRLEEIGSDIAGWRDVRERYPTLVILDGFDEMTNDLTRESIKRNIQLLRDCREEFSDSRIIFTSRGRVFGSSEDERGLLERIGKPEVLTLAPCRRSEIEPRLRRKEAALGLVGVVDRLKGLNDPIGLAKKPLYFEMICEVLPDLGDKAFDERVLYELYIPKTLRRKIEGLEDTHLQVGWDDIVANLVEILECVALELHRNNADHVHLRGLDTSMIGRLGDDDKFARLLWKIRDDGAERFATDVDEEDATARVSIRSLLKGIPKGDPERWPVDFFHRSMREYFVARALVRLLRQHPEQAREFLGAARLTPEILHFAALILGGTEDPAAAREIERLARYMSSTDAPSPLGGNAVSLLYAHRGELPGRDWSGLCLDNAVLPGADLSGKSFRGSTLRDANLDNVNLDDADLRDADLTGVRLEETAQVTALATRGEDTIYAAYGDGSIREWVVGPGQVTDSEVGMLSAPAEQLWCTPGGRVVAVGGSVLTLFARRRDGRWATAARFFTQSRHRPPACRDDVVLFVEEQDDNRAQLTTVHLTSRTTRRVALVPVVRAWTVAGERVFAVVTPLGIVVSAAGTLFAHIQVDDEPRPRSVALLAVDDGYLLAIGRDDGVVALYEFGENLAPRASPRRRRIHEGPVTSVAFLGEDRLVTGGTDRSVCLVMLDDLGASDSDSASDTDSATVGLRRLVLTIRCRNVRTEGMKSQRELNLIRRQAAKSAEDDASWESFVAD